MILSLPSRFLNWFIDLFISILDPGGFIKNIGKGITDKINWVKD
jgi:hypothetical protein